MQITSTSTAAQSTSQTGTTSNNTSSTDKNSAAQMSTMFMQLLIAELKSQNPTSPQDPAQFVGQLAQFNSLSELQQIRSLLQTATAPTTTGETSPTTGGK